MKVAVVYPETLYCGWNQAHGIVDVLRRTGRDVEAFSVEQGRGNLFVDSNGFDGVLVVAPENIWRQVRIKGPAPVAGWCCEPMEREDYGKIDPRTVTSLCDHVFTAALQDEKHGFTWLPFGVDTEMFFPDLGQEQDIDIGFIGMLYEKRMAFLKEFGPMIRPRFGDKVKGMVCGSVSVQDIDGLNYRDTAERYAQNIRRIKVFLNLPTLSQLAVSKIYEVLACGVPIVTPEVSEMGNLAGLPVSTYRTAQEALERLGESWESLPEPLELAKKMHDEHRLELRLDRILAAFCGQQVAA